MSVWRTPPLVEEIHVVHTPTQAPESPLELQTTPQPPNRMGQERERQTVPSFRSILKRGLSSFNPIL